MTLRALPYIRLRALAVVVAASVLLIGAAVANSQPSTSITIDDGLTPRLDPTQVISLAKSELARMAASVGKDTASTILSVHAARGSSVAAIEKGAPGLGGERANEIIWVVRGTGTFVGQFGRGTPPTSSTGYVLIDDTGDVIGMGLP
jgi:hypothetical protein